MAATPVALAQNAIKSPPEGFDLYSRFALAGAIGCSFTHGAFTPVDVYVFPFNRCHALTHSQRQDQDSA